MVTTLMKLGLLKKAGMLHNALLLAGSQINSAADNMRVNQDIRTINIHYVVNGYI